MTIINHSLRSNAKRTHLTQTKTAAISSIQTIHFTSSASLWGIGLGSNTCTVCLIIEKTEKSDFSSDQARKNGLSSIFKHLSLFQ